MPEIHADNKYIDALLSHDTALLEELYARYSGKIKYMVIQNKGSEADAADLFQEAILDMYKKAKAGFTLTCPIEAFLYLICRNRWMNKLTREKNKNVTFADDEGYSSELKDDSFANAEQILIMQNRKNLIETKLAELGGNCMQLLQYNWAGKKLEEIAGLMKTSYAYIRKKKSDCMGKLIELIKNSPDYKLLIN
ncbi:MAG: sigma-70 family RNA polymerase sigma factor [Chitinophagaceae bacterium]|nr:sigma-70 family RNA polymerase sigma factor [Chitinophagaceae bacterium]